MIRNTNGTTYGSPVNNYGYFLKVANRDAAGGWGGIWVGYSTGENYLGRTATSGSYASWEKIWTDSNDGSGTGLDADLLDGIQGSQFLRNDSNGTLDGNLTLQSGHYFTAHNESSYNKYSMYGGSSAYAIGMKSGNTYGGLSDWAMTFTFNDVTTRGFLWRDTGHAINSGAMALTTNGKATIAHSLRVGYGESDTTIPGATYRLDVSGGIATNYGMYFTNGNTNFIIYNNTGDNLIYLRDITNGQMLQTWTTSSTTIHKVTNLSSNLNVAGNTFMNYGLVVNETANDADFRVEGTSDTHLLLTDAANNRVGIGTASPADKMHIYLSGSGTGLRLQGAGGQTAIRYQNDAQSWYTGINSSEQFYWYSSQLAATTAFINTDGNFYSYYNFLASTNNAGYAGRDTGGTVRNVIKINSSNQVQIGDNGHGGNHLHYPNTYTQISTNNGYLQIGPQNVSHCHYTTDRSNHWFNQMIYVNGGVVSSYNSNLSLRRNNDTADQIQIEASAQNFIIDATTRMRLTSSGLDVLNNIYFGTGNIWQLDQGSWTGGSANQANIMLSGASGTFGIHSNSGNADLLVDGAIRSLSDVVAYYSDIRLKHKFEPITSALEKVQSLEGFTYESNELAKELGYNEAYDNLTGKRKVGVSAQQVQEVLPEAVTLAPFDTYKNEDGTIESKSGKDYLTVKYEKIVPLLIEAIKEQQQQINELKEKLNG
jgi:hypothetical protein